ncbi:hypothetical protein [Bradyrhizobium sp. McL0616]|uniref:hypothetical protein n=1 Tax=Bradyrhizobium sp. McL0616 TaxID=3415674 RepID=UPI003CF6F0C7
MYSADLNGLRFYQKSAIQLAADQNRLADEKALMLTGPYGVGPGTQDKTRSYRSSHGETHLLVRPTAVHFSRITAGAGEQEA